MKNGAFDADYLKDMADKEEKIISAALKRYQKLEGERKGARKSRAFDQDAMKVRRSIINTYDACQLSAYSIKATCSRSHTCSLD